MNQERKMYTLQRLMTAEEYQRWLETSMAEDWQRDGVLSWVQLRNARDFGVDLQKLLGQQVLIRREWPSVHKLPTDAAFMRAHEEAQTLTRRGPYPEWTMRDWSMETQRIQELAPEHLRHLVFAEKVYTSELPW